MSLLEEIRELTNVMYYLSRTQNDTSNFVGQAIDSDDDVNTKGEMQILKDLQLSRNYLSIVLAQKVEDYYIQLTDGAN
jgi:hypothetical protein